MGRRKRFVLTVKGDALVSHGFGNLEPFEWDETKENGAVSRETRVKHHDPQQFALKWIKENNPPKHIAGLILEISRLPVEDYLKVLDLYSELR